MPAEILFGTIAAIDGGKLTIETIDGASFDLTGESDAPPDAVGKKVMFYFDDGHPVVVGESGASFKAIPRNESEI